MHAFDGSFHYRRLQDREEQLLRGDGRVSEKMDLDALLAVRDSSISDARLLMIARSCMKDLESSSQMNFVLTLLARHMRCDVKALRAAYARGLDFSGQTRQDPVTEELMNLALDILKKTHSSGSMSDRPEQRRNQTILLVLFHQWFQLSESSVSAERRSLLYREFIDLVMQLSDADLTLDYGVASNLLRAIDAFYDSETDITSEYNRKLYLLACANSQIQY